MWLLCRAHHDAPKVRAVHEPPLRLQPFSVIIFNQDDNHVPTQPYYHMTIK